MCIFTWCLYVCFIVQRTQHKNSFLVFNVLSISPPASFSKKKRKVKIIHAHIHTYV